MRVIDYLNTEGNSIDTLNTEFGIRSKIYESGLVVLNYDQIESPKNHPIADECRGLIIEQIDSRWVVVSKSFNRFYNLGECDNIPESWDDYQFLEKADGSIIKIYWHRGRWEISTRGTAYAESPNPSGVTFRQMVLDVLDCTEEEFQENMYDRATNLTGIFELIGPMNRIVTPYQKGELVFLGFIDNDTQQEIVGEALEEFRTRVVSPFRNPKVYQCSSKEEVESLVSSLTDLKEGVVCFNPKTGHRIKVKALAYLTAHRIRGDSGTPTPANICELVVTNETGEFLAYFPEFQSMFDVYINKFDSLIDSAEAIYEETKDIESQKEFALAVKDHPLSGILFTSRAKNSTIRHALSEAKTSMLIKVLLGK